MVLPPEVERFLHDHVQSVAGLETLLLLHAQAARSWNAEELARELRLSPSAVAQHLRTLLETGFVREEPGVRVKFGGHTFDAVLSLVSTAYRTQPAAVIAVIFSKPSDKVNSHVEPSPRHKK